MCTCLLVFFRANMSPEFSGLSRKKRSLAQKPRIIFHSVEILKNKPAIPDLICIFKTLH